MVLDTLVTQAVDNDAQQQVFWDRRPLSVSNCRRAFSNAVSIYVPNFVARRTDREPTKRPASFGEYSCYRGR